MSGSDLFDVILVECGYTKVQVIGELWRLRPDLPLEDIYRFVAGMPCTVMPSVTEAVAQAAKARLEAKYATVEIRTAEKFSE
jgi:ribosomal protein L7/L12